MPEVRPDVIHRLKDAKGWSQERLANAAGIDPKTLSGVLAGKSFRGDTLIRIADALGVEPGVLLAGSDGDLSAPAKPEPRIDVTLTIGIPFSAFDQQSQLAPLIESLTNLMKATGDIRINGINSGSVNLSLSLTPEDAKRLVATLASGKLDELKVTQLIAPRQLLFTLLAGTITISAGNPFIVPLMPFAGFFLLKQRLKQAGIQMDASGANVVLKRVEPASGQQPEPRSASDIREAIDLVTPDFLLPTLPARITVALEPADGSDAKPEDLASGLVEKLEEKPTLAGHVTSTPGKPAIDIDLQSPGALRDMSEVILTHYLDQPLRLVIESERKTTFLGGDFTMKTRSRMSLDSDVWESVVDEVTQMLGN